MVKVVVLVFMFFVGLVECSMRWLSLWVRVKCFWLGVVLVLISMMG